MRSDQQKAIDAIYEDNRLLVSPLGGGKTIIAATAITELLEDGHLKRVLIVTTPTIARGVWKQEFAKWEHTHKVSVGIAIGAPDKRLEIIQGSDQVVVATFNVLPWVKKNKLFSLFDGLLIDETTKLKTVGSSGFKSIRNDLKNFKWRVGLTGTPVSENFMALFAQIMLIDDGATLGKNKENFLYKYFYPVGYKNYNWELRSGAAKELLDTVSPIVHVTEDYRGSLPPITFEDVEYTLPEDQRKYYDRMRKDMITEHAVSSTTAVLLQKLTQIASGFIYEDSGDVSRISDKRYSVLRDLLENKHAKDNILLFYWFREDLEKLTAEFPYAETLDKKHLREQVQKWNNGDIKLFLVHPKSAGHGLQLEQGGHIAVWLTPQYSNDLWQQANARLWRHGQEHPVVIYRIVATDTVDELPNKRVDQKQNYSKLFHWHLSH